MKVEINDTQTDEYSYTLQILPENPEEVLALKQLAVQLNWRRSTVPNCNVVRVWVQYLGDFFPRRKDA